MPENWNILNLKEIAKVIDSLHKTPKYSTSGYPMVRAQEIVGGYLNLEGAALVSKEVFDDFSRNHTPTIGDLVFSRVGAHCGKTSYVNTKSAFCLGQNTVFIVPTRIDNKLLYYILSSPSINEQIQRNAVVSSYKTISLKTLRELQICFPKEEKEQKSIASILSALDDKIELNLQMNKTLEEMAMALYKHWFVDFGPFQDGEFVDSELGEIPKGWEIKKLDEILEFKNQGVNTTTEKVKYSDSGIPVIRANNISSNKIDISNLVYVDEETFARVRVQCKPSYGDILYTNIGSQLGNASLSYMDFQYLIAWNVLRIKVDENIYTPELLVTFFNNPKKREEIRNLNSSSTMPFVSGTVLGKIPVIVPDKSNLDLISQELKNLYSLKSANHKENETIIQLRDTLLPKLISGEVRVKDVEKTLSEVL